ncbi:MAG: glycosyltransferase family 2 protein [Erysipelotrichaceae bacterium]
MVKVTVFTPTYNRSQLLNRLYESLINQTNFNFEWLIVDDGSTDNTNDEVETFITQSNKFSILYFKQSNGGKHKAINLGVEKANGELFFIVDSDDYLPNKAIERIIFWENSILEKQLYAGVSGLKYRIDGKMIGSTFEKEYLDCTSLERRKYNIKGDKAEVFYTSVLQNFPFPMFENENFLSEYLVWYRIANTGLKIRWFNENTYFCEYILGGLSSTSWKSLNNPIGLETCVRELIRYKQIDLFSKIKLIGQYAYGIKLKKKDYYTMSKRVGVNVAVLFILAQISTVYVFVMFERRKVSGTN